MLFVSPPLRGLGLPRPRTSSTLPPLTAPYRRAFAPVVRVVLLLAVHGGHRRRNVWRHAAVCDVVRRRRVAAAVDLELLVLMGLIDGGSSGGWRAWSAVVCRSGRRRRLRKGRRAVLWMSWCWGSTNGTSSVFVGAGHGGRCVWMEMLCRNDGRMFKSFYCVCCSTGLGNDVGVCGKMSEDCPSVVRGTWSL
ncbi:hypothetical protein HDK77DRAFT_314119 [Phyllosticta capitalensis]|uniref:Uncharacterized protein n=1 Tax=Phyllosticta capitalensis TaxID=121624 RepID=A0ABR1YI36_9PEZI